MTKALKAEPPFDVGNSAFDIRNYYALRLCLPAACSRGTTERPTNRTMERFVLAHLAPCASAMRFSGRVKRAVEMPTKGEFSI
jgi:hypothetical protein